MQACCGCNEMFSEIDSRKGYVWRFCALYDARDYCVDCFRKEIPKNQHANFFFLDVPKAYHDVVLQNYGTTHGYEYSAFLGSKVYLLEKVLSEEVKEFARSCEEIDWENSACPGCGSVNPQDVAEVPAELQFGDRLIAHVQMEEKKILHRGNAAL